MRIAEDKIAEEELLADIAFEEDDDGDIFEPCIRMSWFCLIRPYFGAAPLIGSLCL